MIQRCAWVNDDPIYIKYHDEEWGVPIYDDRLLFEFLVLEGMQAGLSWITVLKKRDNYRTSFDNFDAKRIVNYDEVKIRQLMSNPGIIRNQLKIRSIIINAKNFIKVQEEFGSFSKYIWQFVEGKPIINHWEHSHQIPATSTISDTMSKDLKRRGFKFIGSTICYAFMQATGMVNDHITSCTRYQSTHIPKLR